ncbi:MAG: hypothetical protein EOP02_26540, partial [Proteobacteria bacterium]
MQTDTLPTTACPVVTAFDWVPDFARGLVRDLRVRWAFEEIGRPYEAKLLGAMNPRPDDYLDWQPFDQVPAFAEGDLHFFESGAILLYLGQQDDRLLPTDPQAQWNAISWLFAALNSQEMAFHWACGSVGSRRSSCWPRYSRIAPASKK